TSASRTTPPRPASRAAICRCSPTTPDPNGLAPQGELSGEPEPEGEAVPDGVSVGDAVVQSTENGTRFDVVCTGARTFTPTWSPLEAPPRYTVSVTRTCRVFPPPSGNDSVCHPGSDTDPRAVTHRYSTCAGSRPTVNVAVNEGVCPDGGGQVPEYVVFAPATVTCTDCAGRVL